MKDVVNTELILDYIKYNNLSKKEFCTQCDISESAFNRIITNKDFYLKSLYKISIIMGVKFYQLFK